MTKKYKFVYLLAIVFFTHTPSTGSNNNIDPNEITFIGCTSEVLNPESPEYDERLAALIAGASVPTQQVPTLPTHIEQLTFDGLSQISLDESRSTSQKLAILNRARDQGIPITAQILYNIISEDLRRFTVTASASGHYRPACDWANYEETAMRTLYTMFYSQLSNEINSIPESYHNSEEYTTMQGYFISDWLPENPQEFNSDIRHSISVSCGIIMPRLEAIHKKMAIDLLNYLVTSATSQINHNL